MKAKNREQYIEAWRSHIATLIHPHIDADIPYPEWDATRAALMKVVEQAADNVFPKEGAA